MPRISTDSRVDDRYRFRLHSPQNFWSKLADSVKVVDAISPPMFQAGEYYFCARIEGNLVGWYDFLWYSVLSRRINPEQRIVLDIAERLQEWIATYYFPELLQEPAIKSLHFLASKQMPPRHLQCNRLLNAVDGIVFADGDPVA